MFDSCKTLKMKSLLTFIIVYVLIQGSCSSGIAETVTTIASLNSTYITTEENAATRVTTATAFPATTASKTTVQSGASINSSLAFSTGSGLTENGQKGSGFTALSTTTTSPGPWRVLTYALSAVSGVFFLAFATTVIILCKMRTRLRQASKTLYPITPGPDDHEYLDLEEGIKKNNKKAVQLTHITTTHEEEEFDSPTFSPTPPAKPKRFFKNPPPVPNSNPPTDKSSDGAPQLPVRAKNKGPQSKLSSENMQGTLSSGGNKLAGSNPGIGETNAAFVNDETNTEDGEMYESYEHSNTANLTDGMDDDDDMDIQGPYEEPVKSSTIAKEQLLQRQGSSTGLPDLAVQRIPSREQMQDTPLPVEEEETYDNEDFGNVDPDSGLPDLTGMQNIDDLQFFDDPDAMTAQVNGNGTNTEDTEDSQDSEVEHSDAPSPTVESLDDLLTYDDADMAIADFGINKDGDDEPGLYEDFDINNENEMHFNIHSAFDEEDSSNKADMINKETSKNNVVLENDLRERNTTNERSGADESEFPKVPPRRKSTIDKNRRSADQITTPSISNSATNEGSGVPEPISIPSVPPRRDLLRKQSESESATGSFDEMVLTIEKPREINWDTFPTNNNPEDIVQLRPGKKVGEQGQQRPRDSYFLYMEEKPVELSETNTNDISDMSGLTEISERSADLNEQKDTYIGSVAAELSEESGTDTFLHINGNVPNTRGSGVDDGGFATWENNDLID
ncbi:uncharacterized protein LOC123525116 [Mercenaria mercenaria]|uniref:uncharacterized protein LOC123525116 n=1 Tax=Mercenaria mercenaria TaxID=6596 RepID=UPI00234E678D|nr:uncharacterized protein LOC123525116 [Mercenaria mercenaria]